MFPFLLCFRKEKLYPFFDSKTCLKNPQNFFQLGLLTRLAAENFHFIFNFAFKTLEDLFKTNIREKNHLTQELQGLCLESRTGRDRADLRILWKSKQQETSLYMVGREIGVFLLSSSYLLLSG